MDEHASPGAPSDGPQDRGQDGDEGRSEAYKLPALRLRRPPRGRPHSPHGAYHVTHRLALSIGSPAVAWFFAGTFGLVVGIILVASWWALDPPLGMYWAISAAAMALAPVALYAQGLPVSSVVGTRFAATHPVANHVVTASLIVAAFVIVLEPLQTGDRLGEPTNS